MLNIRDIKQKFHRRAWHGAQLSYSQSGEDLIIRYILHGLGVDNPTYIDVGAYHPYHLSNTAHFYESGCHGINIEPNPLLFKAFEIYRKNDINLNIGVLAESGEMDFYTMTTPTMSTFAKSEADKLVVEHDFKIAKIHEVKVETLPNILAQHSTGAYPTFMTLDAEGVEEQILRSIDFENWSPLVICCETISYSEKGEGKKNQAVIEYLQSKGYMIYADTYINTIFVLEAAWKKRK